MTTRIIGTGSALPEQIITNDGLAQLMDTSDEWIRTRTGIRQRHLVNDRENVASLACQAARRAMEDAGVQPEDIELILVGTSSSESYFPSVACQVSGALGLGHAAAMDISAACSGFLFALNTAHAYIMSGACRRILVIGADTLSRMIDWSDRSTCVLFGDGAGACVVEAAREGLIGYAQYSDGSQAGVLCGSSQMLETPAAAKKEGRPLYMDGQAVFKFAVKKVPECISTLLTEQGLAPGDVDAFVLHQANSRIIQSVAKRLHVSEDKFPMNLDQCGNTSAASIPVLLDELNRSGRLERGQLLVLSGFGAGLTWGASLLRW